MSQSSSSGPRLACRTQTCGPVGPDPLGKRLIVIPVSCRRREVKTDIENTCYHICHTADRAHAFAWQQ